MVQKMRRYIKAFSKDDDNSKEKEAFERTDTLKESSTGSPWLRPKLRGGFNLNRKSLTGWQMIRHSTLGLDMEQEDPEEDQAIRYV